MEKKRVLYADLALFMVAIIWGSGFVVTKNVLVHITPFYMLGFRFIIAAVAITIFSLKRFKRATKLDIKAGIVVGFFMFLGFATQTIGIMYTPAGVQAFITASNVVMVPFMFWLISKKKPNNYEMFGAILCFVGIGILSLDSSLKIGYGEFLTLLCAVAFAMQIVAVGYFAKDVDPYVLSTVQFYFTGIMCFILAFIFEPRMTNITGDMIIPIVYLAVFGTLIAFLVQNIAQIYTSSTHTAIILSLEAVFGSIFSILLLSEPLTIKFIIGCSAILISVLASETKFAFLKRNKRETLDN